MFRLLWRRDRGRHFLWKKRTYLWVTGILSLAAEAAVPPLCRINPFAWWWAAVLMTALPTVLAPALAAGSFIGEAEAADRGDLLLASVSSQQVILSRFLTLALPLEAMLLVVYGGLIGGFLVALRQGISLSSSMALPMLVTVAGCGLAVALPAVAFSLRISRRCDRLAPAAALSFLASGLLALQEGLLLAVTYEMHQMWDSDFATMGIAMKGIAAPALSSWDMAQMALLVWFISLFTVSCCLIQPLRSKPLRNG